MRSILVVGVWALTPALALAQIAPPPPTLRPPVGEVRLAPRTVDEVTVLPRAVCLASVKEPDVPPPKIVSVFPGKDAVLRPGLVVIRVTFDRPMSCDGFFFSDPNFDQACPTHRQDMLLSFDRLTIRTVCRLKASSTFHVWMNDTPVNGPDRGLTNRFVSLTGAKSEPFELVFATNNQPAVRTIREALSEDPHSGVDRIGTP